MSRPVSIVAIGLSVFAILAAGVTAWYLTRGELIPPEKALVDLQPTPGLPWFVDATAKSGIQFQHFDNGTSKHYPLETMGSGLAWIDYDNDGLLDLFCVQTGPILERGSGSAPTNKLFRNNGDGTFTDVTVQVGLDRAGLGTGCAVGDFDNDGFDDLVVTYFGGVVLYHNEPDGKGGRKFVDVTEKSKLHNPHWSTSCAWGDIDGDGFLDLYICNYFVLDLQKYVPCINKEFNKVFSCPPSTFDYVHHKLFRNKGDGTFEDISVSSGIAKAPAAPGLAVIMIDLDDDGLIDIYAANDMKPSYLFHNLGGGKFQEKGLRGGAAMQPNGRGIAGMGVEAGDVDGSGLPSLFVTNFQNDPNMLFVNKGKMFFQDASYPSGIGSPSLSHLSFGCAMFDADLDGNLDIAVATGHIDRNSQVIFGAPFEQTSLFFKGDGKGKFRDISPHAGPYYHTKNVARGIAWADFNNDGRPDLAISHNGGMVALLENKTTTTNRWLRLELQGDGKKSNHNAIGAKVVVEAGGRKLTRWVQGGGSYQSASDRRLLIGLGDADKADRLTIRWPSGRVQLVGPLSAQSGYLIREGEEIPQKRK